MNISSVANLDGVSQLQNFIILQMKVDILYLELLKLCAQKILICLIWGNFFGLKLKIWILEIKTIQRQLGI